MRLTIETLESRHLLTATVLAVDTFDDVIDPDDDVTSLREAVIFANENPGDFEIRLEVGTYALTIPGLNEDASYTGNLNVLDNGAVTIVGAGPSATIIDASGIVEGDDFEDDGGVLTVENTSFRLEGLAITGGGAHFGGAIRQSGGRLAIDDTALTSNSASNDGGGVYFAGGTMTVANSSFVENHARSGGAMQIFGAAKVRVDDSTFQANSGSFGAGALHNDGTRLTVANSAFHENISESNGAAIGSAGNANTTIIGSTLYDNRSDHGGGAISNSSAVTRILYSTIHDNYADFGPGAIDAGGGLVAIDNSTIYGNESHHNAGAIFNSAVLELNHSTVSGNSSELGIASAILNGSLLRMGHSTITGNGGSIFVDAAIYMSSPNTLVMHHSIVAGNVASNGVPLPDIYGQRFTVSPLSGFNLIGTPDSSGGMQHGVNGNIVGDGLGGVIDIHTVLDTNLADNGGPTLTHALVGGSPAIDAGDPEWAPVAFDQRGAGYARLNGPRVDLGAVEAGTSFETSVVGRHLFYDNSRYDVEAPGVSAFDGDAIDPAKQALLPGSPLASPSNVSNVDAGITGIMIDIAGEHPDISVDDLSFRMGDTNAPQSWQAAPAPSEVVRQHGLGVDGADRLVIVWPKGAIRNTYLQVTLAAGPASGLPAPDVFYFGNRVGDTFEYTPSRNFVTSALDELQVRGVQPTVGRSVSDVRDFDKDGQIDAVDVLIARYNTGLLRRIQIPANEPTEAGLQTDAHTTAAIDAVAMALAISAKEAVPADPPLAPAEVDAVLAMRGPTDNEDPDVSNPAATEVLLLVL